MKVTVLLVVHNYGMYIKESIESVLNQTYSDFELLIINNGSTDDTLDKIEQFDDKRIRLINYSNNNYIQSLNNGLKISRGKYIARMDGDDIMLPQRLQMQVSAMDSMPDVIVCASWMKCFGNSDFTMDYPSYNVCYPLIQMLKGNIIAHPTTMIRKCFLFEHQIVYQEKYIYAEDYKLWSDIAMKGGGFFVIPQILLNYRCSFDQISVKKTEEQSNISYIIKNEILDYLLNLHFEDHNQLVEVYNELIYFNKKEELSSDSIFDIFCEILSAKMINA